MAVKTPRGVLWLALVVVKGRNQLSGVPRCLRPVSRGLARFRFAVVETSSVEQVMVYAIVETFETRNF